MVSNYSSNTAYAWWLMEHFWTTQAKMFEQAGFSTFLAYPKITTLPEAITNSNIIDIELTLPWTTYEEEVKAKKFITENNISCIYFTDQPYLNIQYVKLRAMGIKRIIIHDHTPGDRPPVTGLKGFIKSLIHKIPWLTADAVLCVSQLMQTRNITNTRIPAHKCIVVQNGIKPITCDQTNSQLRAELGLKPETTIVITTGRAHPYKRFDFVIRCAKVLRESSPELDIVFLLVGDGPSMSELTEMVKSDGLEGSVRLLGFRSDVSKLLCTSDIALHAALGEGFSLSIIEYMSAGLPVLVPDIPSVSQATKHNVTGFIYSPDDSKSVVKYITDLTTNPEKKLTMGNSAKQDADNLYTLEKCTQRFIDVLSSTYTYS